jgi:deoxyribodipyrimidine photo-lyase
MPAPKKASATGSPAPAVYWLRQDLRLSDNPALCAALEAAGKAAIVAVYIWAPREEGDWQPGAATKVWLHHSLSSLKAEYEASGGRLAFIKAGPGEHYKSSLEALKAIAAETRATTITWNRRYEPAVIERDSHIKTALKAQGLTVSTFNGTLLQEPWEVATKEDKPYQVFTPFWRACLAKLNLDSPLSRPQKLTASPQLAGECSLEALELLPAIKWDGGIRESWQPGEKGAFKQLDKFLAGGIDDYYEMRNRPDREGVSRLSPHMHFGEISVRSLWYAVKANSHDQKGEALKSTNHYLSELGWREFSHHLIYHFPHTTNNPLREDFNKFPWQEDPVALAAWQKGMTGYPIVDAGMRELWHTGIMHNRVRMIVASFLVKDLRLNWLEGARWFWDTLVDADLAQNTMGWQWAAGCGADAAPYFRVFNPILQGEKFDPDGAYVRRWVPELSHLDKKYIHKPWEAPPLELAAAQVVLGETYPRPIVDHTEARNFALAAFQRLKELRQEKPKAEKVAENIAKNGTEKVRKS